MIVYVIFYLVLARLILNDNMTYNSPSSKLLVSRNRQIWLTCFRSLLPLNSEHVMIHLYGLLTKCEDKMAGYWPRVEVHKLAKKKKSKANMQLS